MASSNVIFGELIMTDSKKELTKTQNTEKEKVSDKREDIFFSGLVDACDKNNAPIAFAVVIDPENNMPIIYQRGKLYPLTRLLIDLTKAYKQRLIDNELSI